MARPILGSFADQSVTLVPAVAAGGTLTLPAPGTGLMIYLVRLEIRRAANAALAGGAILSITSTNLPNTPSWVCGNAMAIGQELRDLEFYICNGLRASVLNTAVTVVLPAPGAGVQWTANAYYFIDT